MYIRFCIAHAIYLTGARAIVIVDFKEEGLHALDKVLKESYPDVKVNFVLWRETIWISLAHVLLTFQVKVVRADAGDEETIEKLCKDTFNEFGQLE